MFLCDFMAPKNCVIFITIYFLYKLKQGLCFVELGITGNSWEFELQYIGISSTYGDKTDIVCILLQYIRDDICMRIRGKYF